MKTPDIGTIVPFESGFVFITSFNHETKEGSYKYFNSSNDALDFSHEISLKQLPEWHKDYCIICFERSVK